MKTVINKQETLPSVASLVELVNIRLIRSYVECHDRRALSSVEQLRAAPGRRIQSRIEGDRLFAEVELFVGSFLPDSGEQPAIVMAAEFEAEYGGKNLKLSKEDVQQFAEHSAVFNVWPFWREFIHTASVKMGVGPLIVPLLKWKPAEQEIPKSKKAQSSGKPRKKS